MSRSPIPAQANSDACGSIDADVWYPTILPAQLYDGEVET